MAEIVMSMDPGWIPLIESGAKTSTIRARRRCDPGDTFDLDGRRYEVSSVDAMPLREAAERCFLTEGLSVPEDVYRVLASYYPDLTEESTVWVHTFHPIGEVGP